MLVLLLSILIANNQVEAGSRFTSNYPCSDAGKYCVSSGTRKVQGFDVHRDCWEWAYSKKCNYPSKNDCARHARCYSLGQRDCILRDSLGNCVNIKKEFSCKRWTPVTLESETVRYGTEDKEGIEGLICEGVPCIDGNCMDKSYQMDEDMVSSVAQLGALSQGKNTIAGFKIFEGLGRHCTKKPVGYQNCCRINPKGWGKSLGAKCSKDEQILGEKRQKNLCIYVGKQAKKTAGVTTLIKHHYCCFSNMLEKVVQVQARRQLGLNFGSGGNPNCRGLTLEELARVDFSRMDFSEVAAEMMQKVSIPNIEDAESRIHSAFKTTRRFNEERPALTDNKLAGVNQSLIGPTAEEIRLEEERLSRLEVERLEEERIASIEAERVETERLAKLEAQRLEQKRLAEKQRKAQLALRQKQIWAQVEVKKKELVVADARYEAAVAYWNKEGSRKYPSHNDSRYLAEWAKVQTWQDKTRALHREMEALRQEARKLDREA